MLHGSWQAKNQGVEKKAFVKTWLIEIRLLGKPQKIKVPFLVAWPLGEKTFFKLKKMVSGTPIPLDTPENF